MKGIWLAEEWIASEEGVCSMGFVIYCFWASDYILLIVLTAYICNLKKWYFGVYVQYDDEAHCFDVVIPINSFLAVFGSM